MCYNRLDGTNGIACTNTNRKFIGIELDTDYCNIAKERIGKEQNNIKINQLELL